MSNGYTPEPRSRWAITGTIVLLSVATIGAVQFMRPSGLLPTAPLTELAEAVAEKPALAAGPAPTAFGLSGAVNVRFALPGQSVRFPVQFTGSADSMRYQWIPYGDSTSREPSAPLVGFSTIAPAKPGFYQLALIRGTEQNILPQPTLAVIVPFSQKTAGRLNGYQIGTYIAERMGRLDHDHPEGFIEVKPEMLDLQVTRHLKLSDFVTHDNQGEVWPKYVALNPRLLEKLELVFNDLGSRVRPELTVDVHSGFRTPSYNSHVARAASDSRHQYGDAADIALDADGDGKITLTDELLVMLAVERVEEAHPELVGGLGMYISNRYPTPYLHIDARGKKTRWKG